jgi:signal transduction histidine kinase
MKITSKLTLAVSAGILLLLVGAGIASFERELEQFRSDITRDERVLGRVLALSAEDVWRNSGAEEAVQAVARADDAESHVRIRWVWLDGPANGRFAPEVPLDLLGPLEQGESVVAQFENPDPVLYTYTPVRVAGARRAAIEISDPLFDEHAYVTQSLIYILVGTAALLGLCAAIIWFVHSRLIGRPLGLLVEHARRVGGGDLSTRLQVGHRDEIGELADEMNLMSDKLLEARDRAEQEAERRIAAIEQLRHADRLAAVGRVASGVAHELGTPLNVAEGHAQLIREDDVAGEGAHKNAAMIIRQTERMATIIRQLLGFARRGSVRREQADVREIVRQTLAMVEPLARKGAASTTLSDGDDPALAAVAAGEIQQVVTNLLINGIQAMPNGGTITVDVRQVEATHPDASSDARSSHVRVSVEDTGIGMTEEARRHLFDPFFTTKEVGEGTGLGLSVSHGIVQDHGGWIEVDSEEGRGTRIAIYLPQEREP